MGSEVCSWLSACCCEGCSACEAPQIVDAVAVQSTIKISDSRSPGRLALKSCCSLTAPHFLSKANLLSGVVHWRFHVLMKASLEDGTGFVCTSNSFTLHVMIILSKCASFPHRLRILQVYLSLDATTALTGNPSAANCQAGALLTVSTHTISSLI